MKHTAYGTYLKRALLGAGLCLAWGCLARLLQLERILPTQAQDRLFSIALPLQYLLYGFVSPAAEEILFRGLLFSLLCRWLPKRTCRILTSVLFALWHGSLIQMPYALLMGQLLQHLLEKDGQLYSCICCHAGSNLAAVTGRALMRFCM